MDGDTNLVIRAAYASELPSLVAALDEQFIFQRGRRHSLADRFPGLFDQTNLPNIFVAAAASSILSALAVRRFDWIEHGTAWKGAMIGAVYTNPAHRKLGIASKVLQYAADCLKENGVDFALLWTAQPAFYARLGWIAADSGMLGELAGNDMRDSTQHVAVSPTAEANIELIETIRQRHLETYRARRPDDYRALPIPADFAQTYACHDAAGAAYALTGVADDAVFVYEIVGDEMAYAALLQAIGKSRHRIMINDAANTPSQQWLTRHTRIEWQDKPLAMWLPLSPQIDESHFSNWYVPYFDRI